ncbi:MAG: amidohydrolase family protein, partial [Euryarchaeota archaeon]|nr:amidohydrolase family protein [Euryarchaeota archaeon]
MMIKNGTVYDPLNGIDGERMDIFVEKGKIVEESKEKEVIDASGLMVMPGGVDIHSHIAGSKINIGRLLRPEDHRKDAVPRTEITRSGVGYTVPTTFVTGYRYAELGYTTVTEAAVPPIGARHVHEEFADTPMIDKMMFPLMGNNYFVLKYIEDDEFEK